MAKNAKLKDALNRQRGVDHKLEKQKKQQKAAQKRKRAAEPEDEGSSDEEAQGAVVAKVKPANDTTDRASKKQKSAPVEISVTAEFDDDSAESEDWETADEDNAEELIDLARLQESDTSDSEADGDEDEDLEEAVVNGGAEDEDAEEEEEDEDEEDDIPLSDIESLASEDKGDVIPHQRLTINNTAALTKAYKSIALPSSLPFSATQAVVSDEVIVIEDIDDDLKRELAFYKQSLDAVVQARKLLKAEGVPFSRPADYFAEMVKTDEHMGKIKKKLVDDAAGKKAAAEARRQRDLKKFGKQVQIAKLQERDKDKRETLDRIKMLKKKRSGAAIGAEKEDDMFDVALEDAAETQRRDKAARRAVGDSGRRGGASNSKRQHKDAKFGFGGKKRFGKSNDAASSADTSGFSVRKMKGKGGKPNRPGKSRRARS